MIAIINITKFSGMETRLLQRNVLKYIFLLGLLWVPLVLTAQCPTIPNSNPAPICDASGFTFSDLNTFAVDEGNGIVWYDQLTGGTAFNTNQLVAEGTFYADDATGTCGVRASITVDFQVDPSGQNLDRIYCTNENATIQTYIDDVLQFIIPSGGSAEIYYDFGLTSQANTTDVLSVGALNLYIVFIDNGGCESQIEIGQIGVFDAPADPTPDALQEFCSNTTPLVGNLDPGTASLNFTWYSNIDGGGNPVPPALLATTPLVDGNTYYVQIDDIFCVSNAVAVTVNIEDPSNAGLSTNLDYCEDSLPPADFDLFDRLSGIPDNTGVWTGPLTTANGFRGTVNISTLPIGLHAFRYRVVGTGACPDAEATVTIQVYEDLSSGTASAANPATFCVSGLPVNFDLFSLIENYDIGGQWTQGLLSTDPIVTSTIDLSGFTPNTYNFTYSQNLSPNPCPEENTTVQVIVLADPNAGDAVNQEFCENDLAANSPFDLFNALDGSQDNNSGTWTDAGNNPISNPIDITGFTLAGSPYVFTYTIDNGACSDSQDITITILDAPDSGTPIATFPEYCEGLAPSNYDLFDLLENEDQTGTWYVGVDTSGATTTNIIDLSGETSGVYNYTYDVDAIGTCDDNLVTVSITINPLPNTGTPAPATFCENDLIPNSPLDLFSQLTGESGGGTWTDDNTSGALNVSDVDLTLLTIGSYNFTYSITDLNGCTNSSTVTITVLDAPDSGTSIATFPEYCEGLAPSNYDLFDLLENEDQTGIWYIGVDTSGATTTNVIDLSSETSGVYSYTYDVDAIGSCDDNLVTVSITINPLPNTGTPAPATFCENDLIPNSPLDLFGQLTAEDTGGTWNDDNTSGALNVSNVDLTLLTIGSYNFTYSITDLNGCTNSSTVTITVLDAPDSGTPIATFPEYCEGLAPPNYDLFDLLENEDQTGTWYIGVDTSGATTTNVIDLSGETSGVYNYTYDVDAIGTCDDNLVTVTITINPLPNTGTPSTATFCENDLAPNSPLDLFSLLTGESAGGTWADDDASGALSTSNVDLTLLTIGSYNFTYTIIDPNSCTSSSTVTVTVLDAPESGTPNTPVEFCIAEISAAETYNLFDLLEGEDQAGTWLDDDTSGALLGNLVTIDGLAQGTYNFTYDVDAIGTCDDVNITVSIIINDIVAPTATASQVFCDAARIVDLVATGNLIQWYTDASGGTPLDSATALVDGEDYYATQTDATINCESSTRTQVDVIINVTPNAGAPNATAVVACNTNTSIDLFTTLDGTEDTGGTWNNDDSVGSLIGNNFDATGVAAGTYSFTYTVSALAPCIDDSETITITIEEPLSAGTDGTPLNLCSDNATVDLFAQLGGTPDIGGTWSPALTSGTGVFDPAVDTSGTYTYTLSNSCGTVSSDIVVTVTQAPDAGENNTATICVVNGLTDLFTFLGGTPDVLGSWSPTLASGTGVFDPATDNAGIYTYTVTAMSPCSPDATAQIEVIVEDTQPVVAIDANPSFCLSENPTVADLISSITVTGTVVWYEDAARTTVADNSDVLIDGEDYYAAQIGGGCESSVVIQITTTVNDTPTPTLDDVNAEYCINDGPTLNTLSNNILEYDISEDNIIWYDAEIGGNVLSENTTLSNTTYYAALYDATTGCGSSVRLEVTPDVTACGRLDLPDGFSPNGDGRNDTYEMDNMDIIYPNFEIEIFNRNGNVVYKGNANTPRFDGTSNQARLIGKGDLPVGVYFYIFKFNNGEYKPEQGRLYLSR